MIGGKTSKKAEQHKLVYPTKGEAQRRALVLLDRDFKVKLTKVSGGWSVTVY